jgi:calmodulin-lysine N-methyltransferase
MRFRSFGLVPATRLEGDSNERDSGGRCVAWEVYTSAHHPKCIVDVRVYTEPPSLDAMMGFNNTGNVCVWPSEEVLTHYCASRPAEFAGKRVCELGAGMAGLAGIAIAVTSSPTHVLLTDGNTQSADNLVACIEQNRPRYPTLTTITTSPLVWDRTATLDGLAGQFDVVVCADCLFFTKVHVDLLHTIDRLLTDDGVAVMVAPPRSGTLDQFVEVVRDSGAWDLVRSDVIDSAVVAAHKAAVADTEAGYDPNIHRPVLLRLSKRTAVKMPPCAADTVPADASAAVVTEEAAAAQEPPAPDHRASLASAEEHWRTGDRSEALHKYDEALAIVRAADGAGPPSTTQTEVMLGKGFALLQFEDEEHVRDGLDVLNAVLEQARVTGNEQQIQFVEMLIKSKGQMPAPTSDGHGACADSSPCDSQFDDVAARINRPPPDGTGRSWELPADAALIKAVSDNGVSDWNVIAAAVTVRLAAIGGADGADADQLCADDAERRWAALAPLVKAEISDPDLERDCGHSCGTCPTRSQCQLHEAVDIEDFISLPRP